MPMLPSASNLYVEVLILIETVFGNRTFQDIIKLNEVTRMGPQSDRVGVLIRRGTNTRSLLHRGKAA